MGETIFGAIEWLRQKVGWFTASVVVILSAAMWLTYSNYQEEIHYHKWAGSYNVHHFQPDSIEYKDGHVRVFWISFPKSAPYGFEEQYILHRVNGEPLGIDEFEHPYPKADPYRDEYITDDTNIKFCNCWGSWIDVGKLEAGTYSLEIRYDYDPFWLPDWSADQRIVFVVN